MNINEMITAMNEISPFAGDFAAHYDISTSEAERIAEVSDSPTQFVKIWENEDWWIDQNN